MLYLLARWVISTIAVGLTIYLIPGMQFSGNWLELFMVALVLALVNTIVRPLLMFLSCPLVLLTLGLFSLVINALMLLLTDWLLAVITIDGFWTAFFASILISLISWLLNLFVHDDSQW
jgi:putative membrane protein